jgi:CRISPR-associated endonuclease Cas2
MPRDKNLSISIKKTSSGVLATVVDLVLVSIYFGFEFALSGYGKGYKAEKRASRDLEQFDHKTLKRAVYYLRDKGLVQVVREADVLPKITKQGKNRLKSVIPFYQENRAWDGRIYLVTYDLPVKNNHDRNILREYIKTIGCGMLQQSVWITPYNPKLLIEEFVKSKNLDESLILVSSMGKDGTVGGMKLNELVEVVYSLSDLNERYVDFMKDVEKGDLSREEIVFTYLDILKDDPQIPFELLPDDWKGDLAYKKAMYVH